MRALLLALCFTLAVAIGAPARADDEADIEQEALKAGPVGSSKYVAALRAAIENAGTRSLTGGQSSASTKSLTGANGDQPAVPADLTINDDPRYLAALRAMQRQTVVEHTLESAEGQQRVTMKSVGASKLDGLKEYPEVAISFEPGSPAQNLCSGVLLEDRKTILTAAHCACGMPSGGSIAFARNYVVRFGTSMTAPASRQAAKVVDVRTPSGVVCEPAKGATRADRAKFVLSLAGRDLALFRLSFAIPKDYVDSPVQLPDPNAIRDHFNSTDPKADKALNVVGFGHTTQALADAGEVKTLARVPVISFDCRGSAPGDKPDADYFGCAPGKEIVAQDSKLVGPCPGDSGGGGYVLLRDGNGKEWLVLAAIVSRSIANRKGNIACGDGAVYSLLTSEHIAWIRKEMADMAR